MKTQNKLVSKTNISNLVKISDLNTKFTTLGTNLESKTEQEKVEAFDSSYFHGKSFLGDDGFSKYVCLSTNI